MSQPSAARTAVPPAWVARAPTYAGGVVALIALAMLVGWSLHFAVLGDVARALPSMKANSAVAALFAGISLMGDRPAYRWAALVPLATALATLAEWVSGHGLGIDQLLVQDTFTSHTPGRPAPQTAAAVLVFSVARLLSASPRDRWARAGGVLTSVYACIVLVIELGWLFRAPELTSVNGGVGVSVASATCMGLLTLGLAARHGQRRPLAYLWDEGPSGAVVRRLLPTAVLAPVLIGVLHQIGHTLGWYGVNLGSALFVASMVLLLAVTVTVTAESIRHVDAERSRISRELEAIFDSVPAALTMRDPRGRLLRYNRPPAVGEGPDAEEVYFRPPIRDDDRLLPSEVAALAAGKPVSHLLKKEDSGREYQITKFPVYDVDGLVLGIGGFAVDITARRAAEHAAVAAAERLGAYLDAAPDATVIIDDSDIVRYANHQLADLLGLEPDDVTGRPVRALGPVVTRARAAQAAQSDAGLPATHSRAELILTHQDGRRIPVEISLGTMATDGQVWIAASMRDVTARHAMEQALREAEQRARHLADHDPLTGIWNRRRFESELEIILAELGSTRQAAGALAIVDIDHFKAVNDTAGHHAGDRLLAAVADELGRAVSEDGAVSRLGGDEFAVMWCGGDRAAIEAKAEQLVRAVTAAGRSCSVALHRPASASVGVAAFADLHPAEHTTRAVLIRADEALYAAKRAGRDRYVLYGDALSRA